MSLEDDSERKKVKTNDETASTEAKKLLRHPATAIGDSRDKKIDRPQEKVNWTDFRNQKAPSKTTPWNKDQRKQIVMRKSL